MSEPIKIILADDHRMVREGLRQILELDGDIRVIGQADDGEQCLELVEKLRPDVLLLDINMPKLNGIQVLSRLREKGSKDKVLMLTIHNEVDYLVRAVELGINGYVLKDSKAEVLKKAIHIVNSGETYIEPSLTPAMRERLQEKSQRKKEDELTRREIEVLKLLAKGLFNKEIASVLNISEKTVKNHVSNIFRKISAADRTQAAVYAIKNNLVELF